MAENEINDIIGKIAEQNPAPNSNPEQEQEQEQEQNQEQEQEQEQNNTDDQIKKQNAAFAQMRVELNQTKVELEKALKELKDLRGTKPTKPDDTDDSNKTKTSEDNLAAQVAKMREELEETKRSIATERNNAIAYNQLNILKNEFNLTPDNLIEFANKAEQMGYNLLDNPDKIVNIYKLVYAEQIIQSEIEKKFQEELKNKGMGGRAPASGPKTNGRSTGTRSINEVLDSISGKIKK